MRTMKTRILALLTLVVMCTAGTFAQDRKILVAYFSWSGNKAEKEQNARPAIKNRVADWDSYDTVFIGCPVWWWTAPMIINTFAESYNFKGKTVIPFCTYASTYRDETPERLRSRGPEYRRHHGVAERDQAGQVKKMELCRNIKWHADDTD